MIQDEMTSAGNAGLTGSRLGVLPFEMLVEVFKPVDCNTAFNALPFFHAEAATAALAVPNWTTFDMSKGGPISIEEAAVVSSTIHSRATSFTAHLGATSWPTAGPPVRLSFGYTNAIVRFNWPALESLYLFPMCIGLDVPAMVDAFRRGCFPSLKTLHVGSRSSSEYGVFPLSSLDCAVTPWNLPNLETLLIATGDEVSREPNSSSPNEDRYRHCFYVF